LKSASRSVEQFGGRFVGHPTFDRTGEPDLGLEAEAAARLGANLEHPGPHPSLSGRWGLSGSPHIGFGECIDRQVMGR
jgi:hypothetical protein